MKLTTLLRVLWTWPAQHIEVLDLGDGDIKGVLDALLNPTDHAPFAFEAVVARKAEIDTTDADDHGASFARRVSSRPARAQMAR
jgi:hypothetical protein